MPQELVPRMGQLPVERMKYDVIIFDQLLDDTVEDTQNRRSSIEESNADRSFLEEIFGTSQRIRSMPHSLLKKLGANKMAALRYTPIEDAGQLDIASIAADAGFTTPAIGAVITMTQSWYTHGLSLGQLLHTIALGPGESTRIAMIDWKRATKATGTQTIFEGEDLQSTLSRSRAISEVTSAVAKDAQQGWSESNNHGFGVGGGLSGGLSAIGEGIAGALGLSFGISYSEGFASSSAFSAGQRSLTASMIQNVLDSTHQASSLARNRRATIVQEVSQEESEKISTRALTNYNHMHALSIQYYEIVQLYKVVVAVSRITPCLFLPIKHLDFRDPKILTRFRCQIAAAGLTSKIRQMMSGDPDMAIMNFPCLFIRWDDYSEVLLMSHIFGFNIKQNQNTLLLPMKFWPERFSCEVEGKDPAGLPIPHSFEAIIIEYADGTKEEIKLDLLGVPPPPTIPLSLGVNFGQKFTFRNDTSSFWYVKSILLKKKDEAKEWSGKVNFGFRFKLLPELLNKEQTGVVEFSAKIMAPKEQTEVTLINIEAFPTTHELLEHLQENALYYSQAVWRNLDQATMNLLLSRYSFAKRPLVEMIDTTPLSVVGNYLAFRFFSAEDTHWWNDFKRNKGAILNERKEDLIPMPSGGVFAEAVLGRFNGAEKMDITRFWNWQDSPIPLTAPEISSITAGGRAQPDMKIDLGDLKPATLNLTVPPNVPDPQGMLSVLNAIVNANMFRDMSGLAENIASSRTAMQTNVEEAQKFAASANEAAKISASLLGAKLNAAKKLDDENEIKGKSSEGQNNQEKVIVPDNTGTQKEPSKLTGEDEVQGSDPDEWKPFPKPTVPVKPKPLPTKTMDIAINLNLFVPSELWAARKTTSWDIAGLSQLGDNPIVFNGDNRTFGQGGTDKSRVEMSASFTLDVTTMKIKDNSDKRTSKFGPAEIYLNVPLFDDAEDDANKPWWWKNKKQGATPLDVSQPVPDNNEAIITFYQNIQEKAVQVRFKLKSKPYIRSLPSIIGKLVTKIPIVGDFTEDVLRNLLFFDIDAEFFVTFARREDGEISYMIKGTHDGFPAYELFVNGEEAYKFPKDNNWESIDPSNLLTLPLLPNIEIKEGPPKPLRSLAQRIIN